VQGRVKSGKVKQQFPVYAPEQKDTPDLYPVPFVDTIFNYFEGGDLIRSRSFSTIDSTPSTKRPSYHAKLTNPVYGSGIENSGAPNYQ
jgi:hypothetical protein